RKLVTDCGEGFVSMVKDFRNQGIACEDPRLIRGDEIGLDAIRERVSAFPIDENDTLLFYYIGHGASVERRHALATSRKELIAREAVLATLRDASRVRPRLIVMMTECCADEKVERFAGLAESYGLSLGEKVPNRDLLGNLLLEHSGVVDVTSS